MRIADSSHPFRQIIRTWWPISVTVLILFSEVQILSSIIARFPNDKHNLAAFGVAQSVLLLFESPILMIFSATIAAVSGKESFRRMHSFTLWNGFLMSLMIVFTCTTPLFDLLIERWMGVPTELQPLIWEVMVYTIPIPLVVALRRFYQGILVRAAQAQFVALGTALRLLAMAASGVTAALIGLNAMQVVGICWLFGMFTDYFVAVYIGRKAIAAIQSETDSGTAKIRTVGDLSRYYYPLALSHIIPFAGASLQTAVITQSRFALESLATISVVFGFVALFRALGLAYQDTVVALLSNQSIPLRELRRFAYALAFVSTLVYLVAVLSPFDEFWLAEVNGLSPELCAFALGPMLLFVLHPSLSVLYAYQRGRILSEHRSREISIVAIMDFLGFMSATVIAVHVFDLNGLWAATIASLASMLFMNAFMARRLNRGPSAKGELTQ